MRRLFSIHELVFAALMACGYLATQAPLLWLVFLGYAALYVFGLPE